MTGLRVAANGTALKFSPAALFYLQNAWQHGLLARCAPCSNLLGKAQRPRRVMQHTQECLYTKRAAPRNATLRCACRSRITWQCSDAVNRDAASHPAKFLGSLLQRRL